MSGRLRRLRRRCPNAMSMSPQLEYAKLSDDELMQLASDLPSLTDEAKHALEAEMRNRNLTALDVAKT